MKTHIPVTSLSLLALVAVLGSACANPETQKLRHLEQGNQYASSGELQPAIIEYRKALQLDDRFGQARYQLALTYVKTNDLPQALRESVRAADLMPEDSEVQLRAGGLLLLARQFEDAATRARNVLEREPKNVDALVLLGNASATQSDADRARAMLEEAVAALPAEPRLLETLGIMETRRGNQGAAESAFKRAVEVAPEALEPRQSLAMYYWSTGRSEEAERTLKEALPLDSGSSISHALAVFYFTEGRNKEAEPHLITLVAKFPDDSVLRLALGDLYARERRFDEAIKVFEPLVDDKSSSVSASATARIAFADYTADRKPRAYDRLNDAITRMPTESDLYTMSARLLLADLKFGEAEAAATAALELTPERFQPLYVLGTAMVEQGRGDAALEVFQRAATALPRAVGPKIQLSRIHLGLGDTKAALRFAQQAVDLDPNQPLARTLLVRVLGAQGDVAGAEQALKPLLTYFPNSPQTQAMAGNVAYLKGDREGARRAWTRALQMDPAAGEALNGLAMLQISSGKNSEAVSFVERALAAQPDNPETLIVAARTHLAARDVTRAEALLQQAIKISPAAAVDAYSLLAGLYFTQKRLDEARVQFESVARQQPSAVGPPTMLGILLQLQGKQEEARVQYERLLQTHPEAAVAANNLAMILVVSDGNLDVALNHAQAASKALPRDPEINDTLGLVYYKKGLATLAVTAFEVSTGGRADNPEFWLHLGQAHAAAGNKVKARAALQQALKLNPKFAGAEEARRALEGLDKRAASPGGSQPIG